MTQTNQVKCKLTKTYIDKSKCANCENLKKCESKWKSDTTKERNNQANPNKIKHFGIWFDKTKTILKLDKSTYAKIDKKSSLHPGHIYDDEWCTKHREKCLINFDKNMEMFSKIDKDGFNWFLRDVMTWTDFKEITDLNDCDGVSGIYIMVLAEYGQLYIGQSTNIKKRIQTHWSTTKEFDRLLWGGVDDSVLSIDSFGPLDTTKIIILEADDNKRYILEAFLTDNIHQIYQLNRIGGGGICDALSVLATFNKLRIQNIEDDARYANVTYFEKIEEIPLAYLKNGATVCLAIKDCKTGIITEHCGCFIGLPNSNIVTLIEYCNDGTNSCYTEYLFDCHSSYQKSEKAMRYYRKEEIVEAWNVFENKKKICIYVPSEK